MCTLVSYTYMIQGGGKSLLGAPLTEYTKMNQTTTSGVEKRRTTIRIKLNTSQGIIRQLYVIWRYNDGN